MVFLFGYETSQVQPILEDKNWMAMKNLDILANQATLIYLEDIQGVHNFVRYKF